MTAPLISVIMTVRDDARYLGRAMESVLEQGERDFEFVIVDDGSTDESPEMVRRSTDSRVRLIRQDHAGVAAGLNRAIAQAKGKFLARQDADDVSLPGRFEAQTAYLAAHPEIDALGTGFQQIDHRGRVQGTFPGVTDLGRLEDLLLVDNPFMHGSMMIRAEVMRRFGGYARVACEDFELWTRLAGEGRLANLGDIHYQWRWHERAVTKLNAGGLIRDAVAIRREYLAGRLRSRVPEIPGECGPPLDVLVARRLGYDYFELGRLFFEIDSFDRARLYLELARRTWRTPVSCLWNRLYCAKYRVSRSELARKLEIASLAPSRRADAKEALRKSKRFPYENPIIEGVRGPGKDT